LPPAPECTKLIFLISFRNQMLKASSVPTPITLLNTLLTHSFSIFTTQKNSRNCKGPSYIVLSVLAP
jgi:hypothetical protein